MTDKLAIPVDMIVVGNDDIGWSAKMPEDPNWCWAATKETVVVGCAHRWEEYKSGILVREPTCYRRLYDW
jgi:hypothetical protein